MVLCIGSYHIVKKSLIKSISDYGYNTCGTTLLMPYLRCWVEVLRVRPRVPGSRATSHPYPDWLYKTEAVEKCQTIKVYILQKFKILNISAGRI